MENPSSLGLTALPVQGASALLLALVLAGFHRLYRRSYLGHWARSWAALAVYLAGVSAAGAAAFWVGMAPLRQAILGIALVAGFWQIGWLLMGTQELRRGRELSPVVQRLLLTGLALLGLASFAVQALEPGPSLLVDLLRAGGRTLAVGLAFLWAAHSVWFGADGGAVLGRRLVSASFLLYGVLQVSHPGVVLVELWNGQLSVPRELLALSEFLAQSVIGLGLVIWLLEEERERVRRAGEQIEYLAYHDGLTGSANRQLFGNRLEHALLQARRERRKLAIVFLDLDQFKGVNDALGHAVGDVVLRAVAERLRATVRQADTVARMGGDEFTVLLQGLHASEEAAQLAAKVLEALRLPFLVGSHEVFLTASLGVSVFPDDGGDVESLLRRADMAMYRAKTAGRDGYRMATGSAGDGPLEGQELAEALRRALVQGELAVFYQPVVSAADGKIEGVEALLRWWHPERGLLAPRDFLAAVRGDGLLTAIDLWVARTACHQIRRWRERGHPQLWLALNLSLQGSRAGDLVQRLHEVLVETQLTARAVRVEVPEPVAIEQGRGMAGILSRLRGLGLKIAIDDFGTGGASLSYLRSLPLDAIKVDLSLVRELPAHPQGAAIAAAVTSIARELALEVIAEGVETEEQRRFVCEHHFHHLQGYLVSPPIPPEECERMLRASHEVGELQLS